MKLLWYSHQGLETLKNLKSGLYWKITGKPRVVVVFFLIYASMKVQISILKQCKDSLTKNLNKKNN